MKMGWLKNTALALAFVGGLNWGLIGFFKFNLVEAIFGTGMFTTIIYGLVGIATIFAAYKVFVK
jgi:uncharacterized membrane protein YuzA (DUF378 family)